MDKGIYFNGIIYFKKMLKTPHLTRNEEHQLAKCWQLYEDEKAVNKLVEKHFRIVISQAYKYKAYGVSFSDLIQEGMLGLIKAAKRFNPQIHDVRFSGYAKWWVKAYIQEYVLKNWSIVRVGSTTSHKQLFFHLNRIKSQLLNIEYDGLSNNEMTKVAELLNVTIRDVENIEKRLSSFDISLDMKIDENSKESMQNILPDTRPTAEEVTQKDNSHKQHIVWINAALEVLNIRERHVIQERFLSDEQKTFDEIGKILGISRERARQIESRAFRKMRHQLIHFKKIKSDDIKTL